MNSPSLDLDNDDSAIFCASIIPKKKKTGKVKSKNYKQDSIIQSLENNTQLNNENTETTTAVNLFLDVGCNSLQNNQGEKNSDNLEKKPCDSESFNDMKEFNESCSSYFQCTKKSSNRCPLCFNFFESDSGCITHMKHCAKKHKVTTQKLLKSLELQKNQLERKKSFELLLQPNKNNQKLVSKTEMIKKKLEIEYDLPLALALSKSLEQDEKKSSDSTDVQGINDGHKLTLTSATDSRRKRKKNFKDIILKKRTKEDRQQMITEKAAVILLEDEGIKVINSNINLNYSLASDRLIHLQNKTCRLWKLSENEENLTWYVEELKSQIMPEKPEENKNHKMKKAEEKFILTSEDVESEVAKLNLPRGTLNQDWKKMINNQNFSDLFAVSEDGKTFYFHSLILSARCPKILEKDFRFIFKKFSLSTILLFLEYVYCGTLFNLKKTIKENLMNLAVDFNYEELVEVLNCLDENLKNLENSKKAECMSVPSKCNFSEISIVDSNQFERKNDVGFELEDRDLFTDEIMIDLTQNSPTSSEEKVNDDDDEEMNETNSQKSFYSFLQQAKKKEDELRMEEENENAIINLEMEKIRNSMEEHSKRMEKLLTEFEEEEESFISNTPNFVNVCENQKLKSDEESATNNLEMEFREKSETTDDFIILSSDSDSRGSKRDNEEAPTYGVTTTRGCRATAPPECMAAATPEFRATATPEFRAAAAPEFRATATPEFRATATPEFRATATPECRATTTPECKATANNSDCDVPYFDPYEDYNHFSDFNFSPIDLGNRMDAMKNNSRPNAESKFDDNIISPINTSVLLTTRSQPHSSAKKSTGKSEKVKKKRIDLSASRMLRKSLGLTLKSPSVAATGKTTMKNLKKRKSNKEEEKDWLKKLTDCIMNDFSNSPMLKSSTPMVKSSTPVAKSWTPIHDKEFVEVTPHRAKDIEIEESVTPYPNYSQMGESLLKDHLSKYGIKKSLGKRKAEKMLKHIYEELHPFFNQETGKLLRKVVIDETKNKKKKICKQEKGKKKQTTKAKKSFKDKDKSEENNSNKSNCTLTGSDNSFEKSMMNNSKESEFEDSSDTLTQYNPSNPNDIPHLMKQFFQTNPDYYEKILLYEPIWVKDLQSRLKETYKKSFKMLDLVNYLDQMCITFRSDSWQDKSKKRNAKKNKSSAR